MSAKSTSPRRLARTLRRSADRALEAGFRPGSAAAVAWLASAPPSAREERRPHRPRPR